jgi:CubicO group peptidase (beta-lactamase class C family)
MSATAFATDLPQNVRAPVHLHGHPPSVAEGWVRWLEAAQHAGGGLWSNLGDLVLLGRAMLAGGTLDGVRVIGRRTLELMTRDATAGFFEPGEARREPHYGLGWGLEGLGGRVHGSARQFGHGGASTSVLWIEPQDGFVLVLLGSMWGLDSNLRDAVIGSIYGALAD